MILQVYDDANDFTIFLRQPEKNLIGVQLNDNNNSINHKI